MATKARKRKRVNRADDPGELTDPRDRLTPKQQRFVIGILAEKTQADAYRDAGYTCANDAIAWTGASMLIRVPKVKRALALATQEGARRAEITAEAALRRMWWEATREGPGSSHSARVAALTKILQKLGALQPDSTGDGDGSKALEAIVGRMLASGTMPAGLPAPMPARRGKVEVDDDGEDDT